MEILGQRLEPFGVVLCAAGEPHGISNPGPEPACYVVFEVHGESASPLLWKRLADPRRWRSRLRRWIRG